MNIIILGAGLQGVTTGYVLASRGHSVTLIERGSEAASECSFANGGQLSYSHAEPWANPTSLKKLPSWILKEDSPLIFRPRADIDMITWGLKFLRQCTQAKADQNTITMLRLGLYSREKMTEIRTTTNIEFDFADKGILHVFKHQKDFQAAQRQADFQAQFGCHEAVLTREEVLTTEPALEHYERPIIGGMLAAIDEMGDPYKFCNALASYAEEHYDFKTEYNTNIESLIEENGEIKGVKTDHGTIEGDAYLLAAGAYAPILAKPLGLKLPIYPMKGYSITVEANAYAPHISLTDGSHKIVYSRLGNRVRVAGTAEFAGYNTDILESRIKPIMRAAQRMMPKVDWNNNLTKWACLRPSTPDGPPILGGTPIDNLYLNTGHGTLGWTQAAGSAFLVADSIEGKETQIKTDGMTIKGRI